VYIGNVEELDFGEAGPRLAPVLGPVIAAAVSGVLRNVGLPKSKGRNVVPLKVSAEPLDIVVPHPQAKLTKTLHPPGHENAFVQRRAILFFHFRDQDHFFIEIDDSMPASCPSAQTI
jgi:hypothetical protein